MAVFKCKMCGGALEVNNESVFTCEYCGTQQTLPKLDDGRRANLYDRANHFRRNNEYDKAMGIYEKILNEDNTDAEAYWSIVLCRYGIEYVEDPVSHKRIPTVNRAQFTSIYNDDNYKSALQYADIYQRTVYEEEAKAINDIQKGILAISQQEEPFDVFICYKETDQNGRRTPDSVLAQDLYFQLKQEGFKVFFARITLEDKLGSAYEPYIFAALNSAKVMVVLGTKPEHFNAVWVKNEWSRYLALIKNGAKKVLIPAYRDMDPYDLPEEFSHLQAQDMGKLGFMQDLIRGIRKIAVVEEVAKATLPVAKETVVALSAPAVDPLLKRAFIFLEDGDWESADAYCEKVLDNDPENALAYVGKLMAFLCVKTQTALQDCPDPFESNNYYQKALRFADEKLKEELIGYIENINARNENNRLEAIYTSAKSLLSSGKTERAYKEAASMFGSISEYKDAATLIVQCLEKAEIARKDAILFEGKTKMTGKQISNYKLAIELFQSISGWKDANEKLYECQKKIEEMIAEEETACLERERQAAVVHKKAEERAKRKRIIAIIVAFIVCAIIIIIILLESIIIPNDKYKDAIAKMNAGNILEAYEALISLDGYKDSEDKAESIFFEYKLEKLKSAKIGDYVTFGKYEQDNNPQNGKEDIEWLVLDIRDGKILVISKYALDSQPYNTSNTYMTWTACSLREWLNGTFINEALSSEEQDIVPALPVSADEHPLYSDVVSGYETKDKVFLLSIVEARTYLFSDSERQCIPTDYAVANGAKVNNGKCIWWLRTPDVDQDEASIVLADGDVLAGVPIGAYRKLSDYALPVQSAFVAVRPALWVDISEAE